MSQAFDPSAYGRHIAADYDDTTGRRDGGAEVAVIEKLAAGGPVLEFGIGTGRLALPLVASGLRVAGIDGSQDMIDQLRRKPGGADLDVHVGDFGNTRVQGEFAVVVLAMNTIYALPSQQEQVQCFRNAAAHLRPGGHFLVDAWIADLGAFRDGRALRLIDLEDGRVVLEAAEIHPADQTMRTNKIFLTGDTSGVFPANHRYAWPAELDLMAELAGLRLAHRWGDWLQSDFTDSSRMHVSAWQKPG